jgi:hypothetical protein
LENTEKLSFFVIAMVISQVVEEEAQFCCSRPAKSGNILAVLNIFSKITNLLDGFAYI